MRIFRAAMELFRERGFEATTVDEITERADVGKGTFFNYFPHKESILSYQSRMRLGQAEETASTILLENGPTHETFLHLLADAMRSYEDEPDLSRLAMLELMKRGFTPSEDVHRRWRDLLIRVLERGQQRGDIRRNLDRERAAHILMGVYITTVLTWVGCPSPGFQLEEEMRARLGLILEGFAA